jgi:hypothetical protein
MPERHEYSDYDRDTVYGLFLAGKTQREIADITQTPRTSVQYILDHNGPRTQTRTGRPQILSKRAERHILRTVKNTPKISYAELRKRCDIQCSDDTIYRLLKKHHMKKWLAKKRPRLTAEHAKKRLEWAKKYKDWT